MCLLHTLYDQKLFYCFLLDQCMYKLSIKKRFGVNEFNVQNLEGNRSTSKSDTRQPLSVPERCVRSEETMTASNLILNTKHRDSK